MSSSNSRPVARRVASSSDTWCWFRWIQPRRQEEWRERLELQGCPSWALTQKPRRLQTMLTVYLPTRRAALQLVREFRGQIRQVKAQSWINPPPAPPLQIGRSLQIVHEHSAAPERKNIPQLHIPHGLAFGSGDHATTAMLLRTLARFPKLHQAAVLDLGTGSGVLALAARLLGAIRIVATDWDADAIRTARRNEELNFSRSAISWRKNNVKRLQARARYDLVLANLFSGILIEAASPIADSLRSGGRLWLSGILQTQRQEVIAAYQARGLRLLRTARRGKWIMLQWQKDQPIAGLFTITDQTK